MPQANNPITGEPVLYAPLRAGRPHAFGDPFAPGERCPFCPGHEADTPPAIATSSDPWRVRVFANKYPPAPGAEVIVESALHDARFEEIEHAGEVLRVYRDRLDAHRGAAYAALFRNEGPRAGASLPHPHSQLVPLPFVPRRIEDEAAAFSRAAVCPLCDLRDAVTVAESDAFRWLTHRGTRAPYEQWIVPKRHVSSLSALDGTELDGLAFLLRSAARATARITPSWNWSFMNFAHADAHMYVDLMPRLATFAGLELGSGAYVQVVDPEEAARRLRG